MRIGIYQDLRDPPRWQRGWSVVAGTALERIEEAERLGFGAVWSSEHHFFEDSYLSQPLTWSAAVAARTSTIRIGTGIVIAPLHKPLEIAEQAAVVDQISGGRVELGLGVGYVGREFEAFGVDRGRRFELTEECIQEVRRLYAEGIVTPGPFGEEIPIWFGGFGPRGARIAGRNGCGLLWLDENLLPPYREGLAAGGHDTSEARLGGLATMIVSNDPERAWAQLEPHLQYQWQSYEHAATAGAEDAGMLMLDEDAKIERTAGPAMLPPGYDTVTPDEAVRRIHAWLGELPVTDVFFWDSVAGMPDELVAEHMGLLGREVVPRITSVGE
jgi:alkanesulfonate monooxygenase SsuD/methylene tetrahydromethanopterin reductase-like flavin-dependent oxidoreductase (luciferase family)